MSSVPEWKPRPYFGSWTPDQERVASHFPQSKRLCVTAANGVGKTHLAADLATSFLEDFPAARIILTAPTQRQVEELLWQQVRRRLLHCGLIDRDAKPSGPNWSGGDGDALIGFATNTPQRMQGFHDPYLFIIIDECSGMSAKLLAAAEGIAVGEHNYILAIGNPNEPSGAFFDLTNRPSWDQEHISALTHPNIIHRREVIAGATTYSTLLDRIRDWCREVDQEIPGETFLFDEKHYLPNDEFRIRYLGLFPRVASDNLFRPSDIRAAVDRAVSMTGPRIAALDIARTGGDRTIYGLRQGDTVINFQIVPADDLMKQAEYVLKLLTRDMPSKIICDAAGLGIGLIDYLRRICMFVEVVAMHGASECVSPLDQNRYANRRARAYGHLQDAFQRGAISIPNDEELLKELQSIQYRHTADGKLQILDKSKIKAALGVSPDKADCLSMLWDDNYQSFNITVRRRRERIEW